MRVALVSRYPRVDTPAWKRAVAERVHAAGHELAVVHSRAGLSDQLRAGLAEYGAAGIVRRYASLRSGPAADEPAETLGDAAARLGARAIRCARLGDADCLAALRDFAPDLLVLVGADLVPRAVLEIPRIGTINAHYGLLPAYRGMNVTEWSVFHGDPPGVTVHMVDPGIDTGDILLREEIAIGPGETFATLRVKHQEVAQRLLADAALALLDGTAERTPQAPAEGRQYYRMHPAVRREAERRLALAAAAR
jgi:folate-dependent phosphoribosylglycinamide formyltransferase PurN